MKSALFSMEPLNLGQAVHDRSGFSCGEDALDHYLAHQAGQDMRRGFANVIVAVKPGFSNVLGYYSLSAASADLTNLPEATRRKMPRYGQVPAVLLGRLAGAKDHQGQGLGALLLADAIKRAVNSELAWAVFLVKAKHEKATTFYRHFGFVEFAHEPMLLWLSKKIAERLLE